MKVDSVNSHLVIANLREKIDKSVSDNFATALLNRMGSEKDSYLLIAVPVLIGCICIPFAVKCWTRRLKV
jgi:hypothetical protein